MKAVTLDEMECYLTQFRSRCLVFFLFRLNLQSYAEFWTQLTNMDFYQYPANLYYIKSRKITEKVKEVTVKTETHLQ